MSNPPDTTPRQQPAAPFSLVGPLPSGRVAIEASAGTGKTFTLANLVVRYVAEAGLPIGGLLVVTFTRAAASELRDRIRSRLNQAIDALTSGSDGTTPDEVFDRLSATEPDICLARLRRAVANFDGATITTIHGFAQQVLGTLGIAAAGNTDATLVADISRLVASVCADLLATASMSDPDNCTRLVDLEALKHLVHTVLGNPGIAIVPDGRDAGGHGAAAARSRLVLDAVEEVRRRQRLAGVRSFDQLLTELRDALVANPGAVATLRRQFPVALVDEFQDTDPVQWELLSTLFDRTDAAATTHRDGETTALVLVADPKQAIYGFRGANVHTYLAAVSQPGTHRYSLQVNWRSDQALLDGLQRLFDGATFGDEQIGFVPVHAAPHHERRRLVTADGTPLPALWLRTAIGPDIARTKTGMVQTEDARQAIATDLARQVRHLLDTAWLPGTDRAPSRRVCPKDVAVLVSINDEAVKIEQALRRQNVASITTRGRNVLHSEAARHWRWLLTALLRPADPSRSRTAMLSWFFGWSLTDLPTVTESELGDVQQRLAHWAQRLEVDGIAEFCATVWSDSGVGARVLAMADGDRLLTDLDHIAWLLQTGNSPDLRVTPSSLLTMLDQLAGTTGADPDEDTTARRVESEAEAVQIMTVHAAKGLEFPVVCLPFLWRPVKTSGADVIFQDPVSGARAIDVAPGEGWPTKTEAARRKAWAEAEARGENLRLAYVGLTRAEHQSMVWWAPVVRSNTTGLARLLFARHHTGDIDPDRWAAPTVRLPGDTDVPDVLARAFDRSDGIVAIAVTNLAGSPTIPPTGHHDLEKPRPLQIATFDRRLDRSSRRWSFSAISDGARAGGHDPSDSTMGDAGVGDEPPAELTTWSPPIGDTDIPLGRVPGGAAFGTLVHEVLRSIDATAPDLDTALRRHVIDQLRRNSWPVEPDTLVAGLRAVLCSPLGPLLDGRRLADFDCHHAIREVAFDLHLGDDRGPAATAAATTTTTDRHIGELVCGHLAPDDPFRPWAQQLATGIFDVELAGHLTGSIDAVLRVQDPANPQDPGRFVVVDYKTNILAEPGQMPRLRDYHPQRLPAAMVQHHYPLQALLYAVALHRYLRWRLPGYRPDLHLGGAAYLFIRGMVGPETPQVDRRPFGVFSWPIPHQLVVGLSDLLHSRQPTP